MLSTLLLYSILHGHDYVLSLFGARGHLHALLSIPLVFTYLYPFPKSPLALAVARRCLGDFSGI